ncbi:MAG: phosphoribosylformylglycinamidine synthase subunit PurS [Firmicutes bacterium]|jgi:phosphoribosylformylglycinamidine synthase|nr:phosphoribosylformylglycinamidine synthase subunit PurS [Bacillota bacterium]
MNLRATVTVTLKRSVLDPQGAAVRSGLLSMGYDKVRDVRVGKHLVLELDGCASPEEGSRMVDEMCRRLLANPVIEEYRFEIAEAPSRGGHEC